MGQKKGILSKGNSSNPGGEKHTDWDKDHKKGHKKASFKCRECKGKWKTMQLLADHKCSAKKVNQKAKVKVIGRTAAVARAAAVERAAAARGVELN